MTISEAAGFKEMMKFTNAKIIKREGEYVVVPERIPDKLKKVADWKELEKLQLHSSEGIFLDIDIEKGNAYVLKENEEGDPSIIMYLSTHSFYESNYKSTSMMLQMWGFPVVLKSWG